MTKVSIVGCGFVGLSLAVFLAKKGIQVIAMDIDKLKTEKIRSGKPTFFEPMLEEELGKVLKKQLEITTDVNYAIKNSQITFVTVGTPSEITGEINLDFIKSAITDIAKCLKEKDQFHLVVIKSTVLPNTTNVIVKPILESISKKTIGNKIGLAMNPEFLRGGSAVYDTENPHLIVIGTNEKKSEDTLETFYKNVYAEKVPEIIKTTIENAEMIKYANNAFLATKISFINTISNICQKITNTNVDVIASAIGKDPRVGSQFLQAGPGYGGSCFPKDVSALIEFCKGINYESTLINATRQVNELQVRNIINLIKNELDSISEGKISILGISFKKDTDDIRESVSIKIIDELLKENAKIYAHDPMAINNARKIFGNKINFQESVQECISNSDCVVIMTDWDVYKELKLEDFKRMKTPIVIDSRRILDIKKFQNEIKIVQVGVR